MSTLSWAACKALLEKQPSPQRKKLLELLPASQRSELQKAPEQKAFFSAISPDEVLDTIHPSWILRILGPYSESERAFFLAALTPALAAQM